MKQTTTENTGASSTWTEARRKVVGTTFLWAGDDAILKQGSFDLRDWQQMYSI